MALRPPTLEDRVEQVEGGEPVGLPTLGDVASGVAAALSQGRTLMRETAALAREQVRILAGTSAVAPRTQDRRFADPAWAANPAYQRVAQSYIASAEALQRVVDQLDADGGGGVAAERARFAANVVASAFAPTNFLATNPAALKRAFDTGGASLARGMRNFLHDVRHNGAMPSQVDRDAFVVGRDLAVTPGGVVARDEVAEVLHYRPSTDRVRARPVLVVPPPIGRFYFLDLAPGRSFVEYAVGQGLQLFLMSWRNPTSAQGHWDLDTYAKRVSEAVDTVREVSGSDDVSIIGFCAGGIIATGLLNHMAATGDERVSSASYAVTLLDFSQPAPITAFSGRRLLSVARGRSRRAGIITSRQMGAAFTWMRPDDLVFNYWVNNYLMGEQPPAFDILAWNADGTNLPGALHSQFLDIFEHNALAEPGAMTVLGTPLHFDRITLSTFVTGAVSDHLTPWKGCYRTTQLLRGDSTFVLSYSGHIASLVNPPGNPRAHYWTGGPPGPDPEEWLATAEQQQGSWWEAWSQWVLPRSGDLRAAPKKLGSRRHPVLDDAPGSYVRERPT
jgi:polyhydroxyalkanoate synthase subunit PhaC